MNIRHLMNIPKTHFFTENNNLPPYLKTKSKKFSNKIKIIKRQAGISPSWWAETIIIVKLTICGGKIDTLSKKRQDLKLHEFV
jgi:hypothetical protein